MKGSLHADIMREKKIFVRQKHRYDSNEAKGKQVSHSEDQFRSAVNDLYSPQTCQAFQCWHNCSKEIIVGLFQGIQPISGGINIGDHQSKILEIMEAW